MSTPKEPDDVKVMASVFSPDQALVGIYIQRMEEVFGPVDWVSPEIFFDRTRYYEKEMGWPLYRRFVSFERLARPDSLVGIKLFTHELEQEAVTGGNRRVNVDPGHLSAERLVLATGKNYVHRIYLGKGIYADLTLLFKRGGFEPLPWTYRDYADPEIRDYFNQIRTLYMEQRRRLRSLDSEHDRIRQE